MSIEKDARAVIRKSKLSRSEYATKSGITYGALREQLDNKRGSSVTAAYWAAAWWVQDKSPSLFSEAFLNDGLDPAINEDFLKIVENLEGDIKKIKNSVDYHNRYFNTSMEDQKELNDLTSHLTCAIRLLRLRQAAINKRIDDEGDDQ